MHIELRRATPENAPALAEMNRELIEDEGNRNSMTLDELEARMRRFLGGEYAGLLILVNGETAGYLLYKEGHDEYDPQQPEVFVRHYLIKRAYRGQGVGRAAFDKIVEEWFPPSATLVLQVLATNPAGRGFWTRLGFQPYCTTYRRPRA